MEKMHESVIRMAELAAKEDGAPNPMAPPSGENS